jgi:hypothetical protein
MEVEVGLVEDRNENRWKTLRVLGKLESLKAS